MEKDPRLVLDSLIKDRGTDYLTVSKLLGRNPAYIQQYIKRGSPKKLDEDDRVKLADFFGVPETLLGGRQDQAANDSMANVPRLAVGASAGHGALADLEYENGKLSFDRGWLRELGADPAKLRIISVQGDSMLPTLKDGDDILVYAGDRFENGRTGIYVLRRDGELIVKRLAKDKDKGRISISSDNDDFPSLGNIAMDSVDILGRVLWSGRAL